MSLKFATLLAAVCIGLSLLFHMVQWSIFAFDFFPIYDMAWLVSGLGLVNIFLSTVPLIIFFLILYSKQTG